MSVADELVRAVICGSVDDGKSTLLGRLLYQTESLPQDRLDALRVDSRRHGTQGDALDFALVVDGLAAEREQGITIDVAYRHFDSGQRRYLFADAPGHEQYTRNMVTACSTADLAIILVDARHGLRTQTRRHGFVAALMGVRQVLLAVNKMDLVDYSEARFRMIETEATEFARKVGLASLTVVPLCALTGENLVTPGPRLGWHAGPALLAALDAAPVVARSASAGLRLPVQWVNRPDARFRGYAGTVAAGRVRPGDRVRVLPSGGAATVARIVTHGGDLAQASAGEAVTLTLAEEIDVSRGDLIVGADAVPEVADQFEATIVWLGDQPMLGGRVYRVQMGTATASAVPGAPKYRIEVGTLEHLAAKTLQTNEIGVCNLAFDRALPFDPYDKCSATGGFILIDRETNDTVGAGLLHFALRRAQNIHPTLLYVDTAARAGLKGQRPAVIWLTGLSGAGKSTIANLLDRRLYALGRHTAVLDGDNVRHGLNRDLGFTAADRVENVRRVAEVARLMTDAGLIVIVSLISPYRDERRMARELIAAGGAAFVEVFVDVPLAVAEQRDPKGLYAKARRGELANFTGIDAPYEAPRRSELHLDAARCAPEVSVDTLLGYLLEANMLAL